MVEVLLDARVAPFRAGGDPFEVIEDGALVIDEGLVVWIGARPQLPKAFLDAPAFELGNRLVTPGLIDCHTHVIFGGDRNKERLERSEGRATYTQQLECGGGVHATVQATRDADQQQLFLQAVARVRAFEARGVTTLEAKSGYGSSPEAELELLRIGRRLGETRKICVRTTLLAGHAYPRDIERFEFVEQICNELLPRAFEESLADAVEVCCDEAIGLDLDDASSILETAYRRKVPTRLQADILSDSAGAALAPAFYARAASHLHYTDSMGAKTLAAGGTAAVLLPFVTADLRPGSLPPVEDLRREGVPIAVATGFNPETAPFIDPLGAARLATEIFGLSAREALLGLTVHAAAALGLRDGQGSIRQGGVADLAIWDVDHPEALLGSPAGLELPTIFVGRRGIIADQVQGAS